MTEAPTPEAVTNAFQRDFPWIWPDTINLRLHETAPGRYPRRLVEAVLDPLVDVRWPLFGTIHATIRTPDTIRTHAYAEGVAP